jgi:hypothetical protein
MMMLTHALAGAALGRFLKKRPVAALAGALSHGLGDVLPHREQPLKLDAPLAAVAFAAIACRYGFDSPEMIGALGGIAPDFEHIPTALGMQTSEDEIFPTHGPSPQPWLHSLGRRPKDDVVQIGLAAAALLVLLSE